MLINFNKPLKIDAGGGFEDGPIGGFVPQMSVNDAKSWKGKRFNAGKEGDRIELRKQFGSSLVLIFVAKNGWSYSSKFEFTGKKPAAWDWGVDTAGKNVRISMNGPLLMNWDQWAEFNAVIDEAKQILNAD